MRKKYWMILALIMILPLLFTVSCAKRAVEGDQSVSETPPSTTTGQTQQQTTQPGITDEELRAQQAERERQAAQARFVNEDIYFEFDSSNLLPAAQQVLSDKADYMNANPNVVVLIEGHCDERGTNAYNMALGQRRADAVMEYMLNLGVRAGRMNTISYGEERPVDPGHNEEAWAKNRRAHFVIQ